MLSCFVGGEAGGVSGVHTGGLPGDKGGICLFGTGIGPVFWVFSESAGAKGGGGVGDCRRCGGLATTVAILTSSPGAEEMEGDGGAIERQMSPFYRLEAGGELLLHAAGRLGH